MTDHDRKAAAHQALADRIAGMGGHPRCGDFYEYFETLGSGDPLDLYLVMDVFVNNYSIHPDRVMYYRRRDRAVVVDPLDDWVEPVVGEDGKVRPRFVLHQGG